MREALGRSGDFNERAGRLGAEGHREYPIGWHTAIDVRTCSRVRADHAPRSSARRAGVAHFARTIPRGPEFGTFNIVVKQAGDGLRCRCPRTDSRRCRTT